MNNTNHGGARAGAGGPKSDRVYLNVRVASDIIDKLDAARGELSRSEFVEQLLAEKLTT